MAETTSQSPESAVARFDGDDIRSALIMAADILTLTHGTEQIDRLAGMVGNPDEYNAIIGASERFINAVPNFFKDRVVEPELCALWVGIIVGSAISRPSS